MGVGDDDDEGGQELNIPAVKTESGGERGGTQECSGKCPADRKWSSWTEGGGGGGSVSQRRSFN